MDFGQVSRFFHSAGTSSKFLFLLRTGDVFLRFGGLLLPEAALLCFLGDLDALLAAGVF